MMYCTTFFKLLNQRKNSYYHIIKISYPKYSSQYHPVKFDESEDRWRERDGVSKNWQLIYKAPMDNWLNYLATYITLSSGLSCLGGAYYITHIFDINQVNIPVVLGSDVIVANNATECLVYLGSFIALHVAVRILLSKYVVRLYKNEDNYLAIFRGYIYNSITKHEFHLKEFKKLKPTFVVSWGDARFGLGHKHGILLADYFKRPQYFNYLHNQVLQKHEKQH